MSKADLDALYSQVGCLLTGKAVTVRLRQPSVKGYRGQVSRSGRAFVVDVRPEMDSDERLAVALHEFAHIVRHGKKLAPSKVARRAPASVSGPVSDPTDQVEREAEGLAEHWLELAKRSTWNHTEAGLLRALKGVHDV